MLSIRMLILLILILNSVNIDTTFLLIPILNTINTRVLYCDFVFVCSTILLLRLLHNTVFPIVAQSKPGFYIMPLFNMSQIATGVPYSESLRTKS
jgi:hypothetical protein